MEALSSDAYRRKVVVLGASGSIGQQAIDVIERNERYFELTGCLVATDEDTLISIAQRHPKMRGVVAHQKPQNSSFYHGESAIYDLIASDQCDIVINGIVGAAGLKPTLEAIKHDKTIILANKEPLVMAGELVRSELARSNALLLPIDSEHNAIFQCLKPMWQGESARMDLASEPEVTRVMLTGSGGAFRTLPLNQFDTISVAQATSHPNWSMGPKVTVDSATMMNKGLEYIEACVLFGLTPKKLEVVIHPQSIVHSMVEYRDGSILAQLGSPDMRIPISNALNWPNRRDSGASSIDFANLTLDFQSVDYNRYPCLEMAIASVNEQAPQRIALNAANEVAVEQFLQSKLKFTEIATTVANVLEQSHNVHLNGTDAVLDLKTIYEIDKTMRQYAMESVQSSPC